MHYLPNNSIINIHFMFWNTNNLLWWLLNLYNMTLSTNNWIYNISVYHISIFVDNINMKLNMNYQTPNVINFCLDWSLKKWNMCFSFMFRYSKSPFNQPYQNYWYRLLGVIFLIPKALVRKGEVLNRYSVYGYNFV